MPDNTDQITVGNEVVINQPETVVNSPETVITKEPTSEAEEPAVRRSLRQRHEPNRLHYAEFGHPLVTVIQSLFQGITSAFSNSLSGVDPSTPSIPVPGLFMPSVPGRAYLQEGRV